MVNARLMIYGWCWIGLYFWASAQSDFRVNIIAPLELLDTSITAITIRDFQTLLEQAGVQKVTVNEKPAKVNMLLPFVNDSIASVPTRFSSAARFPYKHFPNDGYEWIQEIDKKGNFHLVLSATSFQGVSFGLYGLLQEKLGFCFLHPKQTIIPHLTEWPLRENFHWKAKPLFDKKGFHLHTQHPIELTEQLLNENYPGAVRDVKEYIDWLARNGQNYFEFCLLNSIQKKSWIRHAKAITDYVHQRGLLASVDLSLHMIQQKSFQLYSSPFQKKKQIVKNLTWITQAPWDFINMEFATAEFIGGNRKKKQALRQFILQWLLQHSTTKLMGRKHVVKDEKEFGNQKSIHWDSAAIALDKHRGVLSHTVMFYDMTEEKAPVYENDNQRHMFQFLLEQHQQRETWYYPESAYWITFDNSIPMLLLPYLIARLADIDTCVQYQIPGHITFSSGWEWGYWLIDWSIARWSWQHTTNGIQEIRYPEMYARKILYKDLHPHFSHCLQLQQHYLKDSMLMEWMTAMTVTDEIKITSLAKQFHPRPAWSYAYIRNRAKSTELDTLKNKIVPILNEFGNKSMAWVHDARKKQQDISDPTGLNAEILDGIEITAMRALHRANTLSYLIAKRTARINKVKFEADSFLAHAGNIREHCLQVVQNRERRYRYPVEWIARKRWDHTAYHFGYLYPASNLHFWEREEKQALKNQYRPLFMNIWNIGRIIGLIK